MRKPRFPNQFPGHPLGTERALERRVARLEQVLGVGLATQTDVYQARAVPRILPIQNVEVINPISAVCDPTFFRGVVPSPDLALAAESSTPFKVHLSEEHGTLISAAPPVDVVYGQLVTCQIPALRVRVTPPDGATNSEHNVYEYFSEITADQVTGNLVVIKNNSSEGGHIRLIPAGTMEFYLHSIPLINGRATYRPFSYRYTWTGDTDWYFAFQSIVGGSSALLANSGIEIIPVSPALPKEWDEYKSRIRAIPTVR